MVRVFVVRTVGVLLPTAQMLFAPLLVMPKSVLLDQLNQLLEELPPQIMWMLLIQE
jgi:hypothetical protein